ncbi:MAG TPA: CRTAC1 family protein [Isosphaeraceae bacterium]|nr:CRTAC1 family protein [Isosphaeraceae bacterium]
MRTILRVALAGLFCAAMVGAIVPLVLEVGGPAAAMPGRHEAPAPTGGSDPSFPLFSDGGFETGGYPTAVQFTGPTGDDTIAELRAAIGSRADRGLAELRARLRAQPIDTPAGRLAATRIETSISYLYMYNGEFDRASAWAERAMADGGDGPREMRACFVALLGVIALRRGEVENCLECRGPSSCILPIDRAAMHRKQDGAREAIRRFTDYLAERPGDLGVRWLLNVAYMAVGEYPEGVPPRFLVPLDRLASRLDVGRFDNVAIDVGLGARGPNLAGGSAFDDFDGDGRPDVVTSSFDADLGASFYHNNGDGTFEDRSAASGLAAQPLAINLSVADFDNDGDLDVLLLRGGWEFPARQSLMRNRGDGTFEDVTEAAGLAAPIASQGGAWGDFDDDGRLDLYLSGEYAAGIDQGPPWGATVGPDPRNRSRLYRNNGDGTFVDVAPRAGVTNDRYSKGASWGDFDDDGRLDLFVSNLYGGCRLYRNNGDGTFADVAPRLGIDARLSAFPCWFFDFDNDGKLDIAACEYRSTLFDVVEAYLGRGEAEPGHPRIYRNLGPEGFRDVSGRLGFDRPVLAMGANFGDVDNDGFLDVYYGTGLPSYSALVPNVLYKNVAGRRFEDVTLSSGTGHLQKGHGVSFADADDDGDLDLFVELGGAVPGDAAHNALFRNPGHGRHWLKVKLVGTKTNRAGFGAKIRVDLEGPDGRRRSIYRHVGSRSSFGGNSLVEMIGLGDAARVATLQVSWPVSRTTQTFRDLAPDRTLEVVEGADAPVVLHAGPSHGLGH